ncbi:uncharacterized protein TNCV_79141 [Trichonephila clavipes]|nr:uncharacterized protein TNCV_79141 [Trichonephila clavipes]
MSSELEEALGNNALPYRTVARWLLYEDRRWMLLELERTSGIEKRTVNGILHNDLHLRKISARWVPYALTEFQRWLCYAICSDHFSRWQQNGDQFLSRIITIDEFWARAYKPELTCQSVTWRPAGSPRKQNPFQAKLTGIVAYDVRGVIVCHFVPHGRIVTAHYYRDSLVRQYGVAFGKNVRILWTVQ